MRFVKTIVPALISLVTLSCAADERPATYRLGYRHPPGGGADNYAMILDGVDYTTRDAFTAAVAKLPPRSRLSWDTGCIAFEEIPLGPAPRMSIAAFKAFCSSRGIRFDYHCGLAASPLMSRTFSFTTGLVTQRIDAREWLQARGVTFPPGTSARWQPKKHRLAVRNTEENIDLIALIIEHTELE